MTKEEIQTILEATHLAEQVFTRTEISINSLELDIQDIISSSLSEITKAERIHNIQKRIDLYKYMLESEFKTFENLEDIYMKYAKKGKYSISSSS